MTRRQIKKNLLTGFVLDRDKVQEIGTEAIPESEIKMIHKTKIGKIQEIEIDKIQEAE